MLFSEPTHGPGPGRRHGTSQRAPVAFTNTQPANTSAAPLNAAAGMAAVVALLSPLPLLQLPRRCLPLSHGRCQYYGHCENAGAVAGGWKMRRRVRSAGRVWMRGQHGRGGCLWGRAGVVRGRGAREMGVRRNVRLDVLLAIARTISHSALFCAHVRTTGQRNNPGMQAQVLPLTQHLSVRTFNLTWDA